MDVVRNETAPRARGLISIGCVYSDTVPADAGEWTWISWAAAKTRSGGSAAARLVRQF
ncbi:MAG: hypothetical protein IJ520_09535 [Synergistaceae bacterium]|nr:hypothetical protein [Synergistaceae bacterium]